MTETMSEIDGAIRRVLAEHTPVDTSGGSHTDDNLIFCGGHQWHEEFEGWQAWVDHVAPLIRDAIRPHEEAVRGSAYMDGYNDGKYEDG